MNKENKISIDTGDFYRLLVAGCRYAYRRNNHLEPSYIYSYVRGMLPNLLAADKETAIGTARQLCEECISDELIEHFYNGEDDEHENRKNSIRFINYLLDFVHKYDADWKPYNYNLFEENIKLDDAPVLDLYEVTDNKKVLLKSGVSKNDIMWEIAKEVGDSTYSYNSKGLESDRYIYVTEPVERDFYICRRK